MVASAEKNTNLLSILGRAIDAGTLNRAKEMLNHLSAPDIAHELETAPPRYRHVLWELIGEDKSGEVLQALPDDIQMEFLNDMDGPKIALITAGLNVDDVVDILQQLPGQVVSKALQSMSTQDRLRVESVLTYDEETAGGLMDTQVITVRADITLDAVLRYLRRHSEIPHITDNLFVVDRHDRFLGLLPLSQLLTSSPTAVVSDVMNTDVQPLHVDLSDAEVGQLFQRQNLVSAPVVDNKNRLLGRITIDDVLNVIVEDADQSLLAMGGLSIHEDTFASVWRTAPRRAIWLGINLATALLASMAISLFEATLDKVVALAILMPIVASMGGVAGSQTLTLIIRGLAIGQIERGNIRWLMSKEFAVGALNGLLWALATGIIVSVWFADWHLALIIGLAMLINITAAALAGTLLPVVLRRASIDPALAGSVILTTITDIVGFVSFLGLSTWLLT